MKTEEDIKKENSKLQWQICGLIIVIAFGGVLLEFGHGFGWAIMAFGVIGGIEALMEENRLEILKGGYDRKGK